MMTNWNNKQNDEAKQMKQRFGGFPFPDRMGENDKYNGESIRWIDAGDHYELIFTDDFIAPSTREMDSAFLQGGPLPLFRSNSLLTDIILDMRKGCKQKEVHVFVGSFGGEVAALSMILQQLLCYPHRVGINLGTACSCGWMLLFACPERYVSPFSQAMYHDMSIMTMGKHTELRSNAEFMALWQKELLHVTDTQKVLTERELELGRTSEVWLTGRQLIERGAARDYQDYLTRRAPGELMMLGRDTLLQYSPLEEGWVVFDRNEEVPVLSYEDVIKSLNMPPAISDSSKKKPDEPPQKETKEEKKMKPSGILNVYPIGAKVRSIAKPR